MSANKDDKAVSQTTVTQQATIKADIALVFSFLICGLVLEITATLCQKSVIAVKNYTALAVVLMATLVWKGQKNIQNQS